MEKLIEMADEAIKERDSIFNNSDLSDNIDKDLVDNLLVKSRKEFYERSK